MSRKDPNPARSNINDKEAYMSSVPKLVEPVEGRLIPLVYFNKYYPDPTPSALRWLMFKDVDGFRRCVVRRGRRVLIDKGEYFRWLQDHNAKRN